MPVLRNRMAVAVLSLLGLFVALYLYAHAAGWMGPLQCGLSECDTVQASRYAKVGALPVPLIGLLGYALLLGFSLGGLQPRFGRTRIVARVLFCASVLGFGFSAYLTYVEAWVLRAWCQYCVASAIIMTLIFIASLPEFRRGFRRARQTHP